MAPSVGAVLLLALALSAQANAQSALTAAAPATLSAGGSAAAAGPCALGLTFFPAGGDNRPTGWTQAVQQNAGNTVEDQLLKIALAGYPLPMLHMAPKSVYTQVGGQVPVSCVGGAGAGVGTLARPAAYVVNWQLANQRGQIGPFTKGSKQDPPANVTLNFAPQLPDGDYCLQLSMELIPGTGIVAVGAQQYQVPAQPQAVQRQVCFYKLASRPQANITFHSCNTSFAVDLTNITPKPQYAKFPTMPLFATVFHVWGKLNRTFTRGAETGGLLDYFDQYVKWDDPSKPNYLQVFMDSPGLVEGYYNVWIEGSLATSNPDLVSLFGLDQYDDGSAKYMGVSLRNSSNRPVPIQTTKSKIVDLSGPDTPVAPGAQVPFTWETQGFGEQFCYVDNVRVANTADRIHCESPLNLQVADNNNHTLEVRLFDVCGEQVGNGIFFGAWGWKPNMAFAPPAPPPPAPEAVFTGSAAALPTASMPRANRTAGNAGVMSSVSGLLMTLAAALGVAAVLL